MPNTSVNGHMISFLIKDGRLARRLPAGEREEFLAKYKTKLVDQHGTVLAEYVAAPDTLLRKTEELKAFFALSYAYVGPLKPNATTKSKKSASKKTASEKGS